MQNKYSGKLIDEIAERIHAKIISGDYRPGLRLTQDFLACEFNVSRTPIREALSRLQARGILSQAHHRSAVVSAPSSRDVREMYQIRAELEGLAAQLSARWIDDQQLASLRKAHDKFVRAVTGLRAQTSKVERSGATSRKPWIVSEEASLRWIDTNAVFHATICEASNNRSLQKVIEDITSGYTRKIMLSSAVGMNRHRMQENIAHHEKILVALEARDPVEARRAMAEHIIQSGEFVAAWLENQAQSS